MTLVLTTLFLYACEHRKEITLSSGRSIQVTSIMRFDSDDGPVMALRFYSKTANTKNAALRSEASEVWEGYFKAEVEKAHVKNAMIIGMCVPKGDYFSQTISGYDYEFKQSPDGTLSITK